MGEGGEEEGGGGGWGGGGDNFQTCDVPTRLHCSLPSFEVGLEQRIQLTPQAGVKLPGGVQGAGRGQDCW